MFFTSNVEYAIAAEDLLHESITYGSMRNEISAFKHYITTHFNMLLQECDMVMDMYDDPYVLYGEANIGEFFKNLGTKIKAILTKIFEWLKNAIKIIGKILLAPFGVIFKSDGKKDNTSGGTSNGGGASSSNSNSSNGSSTSSPTSGGNLASTISEMDGVFKYTYITDDGFKKVFPLARILSEIIDNGDKRNLFKESSYIKQYTNKIGDDYNVADLKSTYESILGVITTQSDIFKASFIDILKSTHKNNKDSVIQSAIQKIKNMIKNKDVIKASDLIGAIFNIDAEGGNTKDELFLMMGNNEQFSYALKSDAKLADVDSTIISILDFKYTLLTSLVYEIDDVNMDISTKITNIINDLKESIKIVIDKIEDGPIKEKYKMMDSKLATIKVDNSNVTNIINTLKDLSKYILAEDVVPNLSAKSKTTGVALDDVDKKRVGSGRNNIQAAPFSSVTSDAEGSVFKVLNMLYGDIEYEVGIKHTTWEEAIKNRDTIIEHKLDLSKTIGDIVELIKKLNGVGSNVDSGLNGKGKFNNDVNTRDTGVSDDDKKNAQIQGAIVGVVRDALTSLKNDITTTINQVSDIEHHCRKSALSVVMAKQSIFAYEFQKAFVAENILYKAIFEQRNKNSEKIKNIDSDVNKDKKTKYNDKKDVSNLEDILVELENKRKSTYEALRRDLTIQL